MALYKEIIQNDGVVTNYHRILFIQSMINSHDSIVVLSYVNAESREKETMEFTPYRVSVTYNKPYTESINVSEAYNYLKKLDPFVGSLDA